MIRAATFIIKIPCSTTTIFISLMWILNLSLKLMAEPTYCSLQFAHVIKYIKLQLSHDKLPLMK